MLELFTLLLALCSEYKRRRRITETLKVVEKVFGEKEREKGSNSIELNSITLQCVIFSIYAIFTYTTYLYNIECTTVFINQLTKQFKTH
jgi:hypothetical protein